jgi:hypothetical protein
MTTAPQGGSCYDLEDYTADRLEFSFGSYEGQKGKEKIVRYTDDSLSRTCIPSGTRRHEEPAGNNQIPVTVEDFILQVVHYIVEEDVSCDSDFMMGVMDRVGKALLAAYKWVKLDEWVHWARDR